MSLNKEVNRTEIAQIIADEFGVNATYVNDLYQQFEQNRSSVDEEWRSYFEELLADGHKEAAVEHPVEKAQKQEQEIKAPPAQPVEKSQTVEKSQAGSSAAKEAVTELAESVPLRGV